MALGYDRKLYILAFDRGRVEDALSEDRLPGRAYLEKIVQVSFKVPRPEAFDLRRWFQDEVRTLFGPETARTDRNLKPNAARLGRVIDTLFCFGLGYSALVLARRLKAKGWTVRGTTRRPEKAAAGKCAAK